MAEALHFVFFGGEWDLNRNNTILPSIDVLTNNFDR